MNELLDLLRGLRDLVEPLTAVVGAYPGASMVLGLGLALFIAYVPVLIMHSTMTGLLGLAGLYWQVGAVLALALLVWLATAALFPDVDCRPCKGGGRLRRRFLRRGTSRACWCCNGSGRHVRLGRRLLAPVLGAHH